jgi:hypothetical protein
MSAWFLNLEPLRDLRIAATTLHPRSIEKIRPDPVTDDLTLGHHISDGGQMTTL